jgi:hypothetical protein
MEFGELSDESNGQEFSEQVPAVSLVNERVLGNIVQTKRPGEPGRFVCCAKLLVFVCWIPQFAWTVEVHRPG